MGQWSPNGSLIDIGHAPHWLTGTRRLGWGEHLTPQRAHELTLVRLPDAGRRAAIR